MQAIHQDAISLAEVQQMLPKKRGKPVALATLRRWVTHGVRGVQLGAFLVGGDWFTTQEDVQRFIEETTRRAMPQQQRSPAQRRAAANHAAAWIDARLGKLNETKKGKKATS